jgi:hypothetical protein
MGFFSDLVGSFTGKSARKDLEAADARSTQQLQQGYGAAYDDYTQATNAFQPFAQQGQEANTFYNDVLMNRGDAVGRFSSNPLFSGELGSNFMAAQRAGNAAGWGAGKEALAGQRVFGQTAGSWLDRYRDAGQQGLQATNAMANAQQMRGNLTSDHYGTLANKTQGFGNAMAANRGVLSNNLLGLAGTVVGGINAFRQPKLGS